VRLDVLLVDVDFLGSAEVRLRTLAELSEEWDARHKDT
jgi:hypothetical protein